MFGLIDRSDFEAETSELTPIRKPPSFASKIAQIQSPYSCDIAAPGDSSSTPAPVELPSDASLVPFDRLRWGEGHSVGWRSSPEGWTPSVIAFRRIRSPSDGVAGQPYGDLLLRQ